MKWNQLIRELKRHEATIEAGSKHFHVRHRDGGLLAILPHNKKVGGAPDWERLLLKRAARPTSTSSRGQAASERRPA